MASSLKLQLNFTDSGGKAVSFGWKYAKSSVTGAQVKALAEALITNGSIFYNVPVNFLGAKLVQVTETGIDIPASE